MKVCVHYNSAMHSRKMMLFGVIVASVLVAQVQSDTKCAEPTALYDQMGCTPEGVTKDNACPTHYNCSFLESALPDTCYHRGKLYNVGEALQTGPLDGCFGKHCHCFTNGEFVCASIDCFGRHWDNLKAGCHFKNEFSACCQGSDMICPKTDPDIQECKVDDKVYYEGQYFYPKENTCLTCICDKGFTGKLEAPFCMKKNCSSPYSADVTIMKENCALYFIDKSTACCPDDNTCPTGKEIFDKSAAKEDTTLHCKYGHEVLPIGTKFETNLNGRRYPSTDRASCECILPPLVTCTKIN